MVKRGEECSLLLKHRSGKMIATLQCTTSSTRSSSPSTSSSSAKKRKKNRGNKKKRLEALLAYHQRLVTEKGLPPSRLMKQHAAALARAINYTGPCFFHPELWGKQFKCDQCKFESDSQRGLRVHIGRSHKEQQLPEVLRDGDHDVTLPLVPDVGDDTDRSSVSSPTSVSDSAAECGIKCACCGQGCHGEEALRMHLRDKHGLPKKCLDCDTMHFNFVSLANCYKAHMGIESE